MNGLLTGLRRATRNFRVRRESTRWRTAHLGPASYLAPGVQVLGWKQVRIGHHTVLSEDCWLNVNDRDAAAPAITIGHNCFLGRRNFLSAGGGITIGDYCLTGVDCHFLGSDHVFMSPFKPYTVTGTTGGGVIEIGPNCWLGSSVTVLKGVKIGYGSILGAASVITRDVPPFSLVVGNPGRVVRRYDVRAEAWVGVQDYPVDGDAYLPGEAAYLDLLRKNFPAIKGPIVASGSIFGDL